MGGLNNFVISLVLVGLFSISIITFGTLFATDNDAHITISDDPDFSAASNELTQNVTSFYSDVNTSSDAMYQSTISSQTEATEGGTAFKTSPRASLALAVSMLTLGFKKIFGADTGFAIFLTALIGVLGFLLIMYLYKAWAGRSPD